MPCDTAVRSSLLVSLEVVSRRPSIDTRSRGAQCQIAYSPQLNGSTSRPCAAGASNADAAVKSGVQSPAIGRQRDAGITLKSQIAASATASMTRRPAPREPVGGPLVAGSSFDGLRTIVGERQAPESPSSAASPKNGSSLAAKTHQIGSH